jgi:hydroxymethylglutaryl-CoA reductase
MDGPPKFRDLDPDGRRRMLVADGHVSPDVAQVMEDGGLTDAESDRLVENAVGTFSLPLGFATGLVVNGREFRVPMAVEEPSVIAAQSSVAKLVGLAGGFTSRTSEPVMIAQIQLIGVADVDAAIDAISTAEPELRERADQLLESIVARGGGYRGLDLRRVIHPDDGETFLVVHLLVDVRDAMGANLLNTLAEALAPRLAELGGGRAGLKILSNLADRRLVKTECRIPTEHLAWRGFSGDAVANGLVEASRFAEADPYRAATHNKGIMNGVDALVVATGNDWRAIEAAAHAFAARTGAYRPLSQFRRDESGALAAVLEMPMPLGTVGGSTRHHRLANGLLSSLGITGASELAEIAGAVGLAQNIAALRALSTEGIQEGHMRLHRRRLTDP